MKKFADLTEREVLAVAISAEEEDSRIYMSFAEDLAERYPDSAKLFEEMAEEERGHRHRLLELYEQRFGAHLPPIRRDDVRGFLKRRPIWLTKNLSLDTIRKEVETMELQAERFYTRATEQAQDVNVRRLLGDLAEEEKHHEQRAVKLTGEILSPDVRAEEDKTRRRRNPRTSSRRIGGRCWPKRCSYISSRRWRWPRSSSAISSNTLAESG